MDVNVGRPTGGEGEGDDGKDGHDDENEMERWQRNYTELLQELRVAQMGVQILFAFLLTLSFTNRFDEDDVFSQVTYLVALLAAAAATALLIAPVAYHRVLFRQGRKPYLVQSAHRMAYAGLGLLVVAVVSAVLLAADNVVGRGVAITVAAATGLWFVFLWGVAPRAAVRRGQRGPQGPRPDGP
jgi:hypothetical protein